MSGSSYSDKCPKCGSEELMVSEDLKHMNFSCTCLDCGFYGLMEHKRMTLEEVNEERREFELDPIDKLKDQYK